MSNQYQRRASLWLLLIGMPLFLFATTYRLKRVSSVTHEGMYVLEQCGSVMTGSVNNKNQLLTTDAWTTSGMNGEEPYVWQLDEISGGIRFYNISTKSYLAAGSNGNMSFSSTSSGAAKWSFTLQRDGTMLIQDNVNGKRYLGYGSPTDYTYKTRTVTDMSYPYHVVLYRLYESNDKDPMLTFSKAVDAANLKEDYNAPLLSKADGFDGEVVYFSSDPSVATVDSSTGEVTLVGVGSAMIGARSAATSNFDADETFYSLRVYDGNGSAAHPYSIGYLLDGKASIASGTYFTGYVVGQHTTSTVLSTTAVDNTCIAIADAKGETALNMVLPVNLASAMQTTYGLKSHPDLLGSRVVLTGGSDTWLGLTALAPSSFAATRDVTIKAVHFATVGASYSLDFSGTDIRAYKATIESGKVRLEQISDGIVPAGHGAVLYSDTPGTYAIPVTTAIGSVSDTGLSVSDGTTAKGVGVYVLASRSGEVGFLHWASESSLPQWQVYLNTGAAAPEFLLLGLGETMAVDAVRVLPPTDGNCYNLQGQRVSKPCRGLYIVHGKKVVVR